jgi:hypothetical protein
MPKSKKPKSSALPPPSYSESSLRALSRPPSSSVLADPAVQKAVMELLDKAEAAIRAEYFASWLKALNDPEGTRVKAGLIGDCFATIRGELTNAA